MKILIAAAALATALAGAAWADAPAPAAPVFTVIEHDAKLPFSNRRVSGFNIARDNSLILDAGPNRWYRAIVWEPCAHNLRFHTGAIGLDTRPDGMLDRFATVIVDGQRCPIESLDRIERPPAGSGAH